MGAYFIAFLLSQQIGINLTSSEALANVRRRPKGGEGTETGHAAVCWMKNWWPRGYKLFGFGFPGAPNLFG